jgi:hypothetical protein
LIKKLGELTFLAHIFIQNNIDSTCPLENSAIQEFEQKWREHTPLNPRQKSPDQSRASMRIEGPI